jgi:hypothetical protein
MIATPRSFSAVFSLTLYKATPTHLLLLVVMLPVIPRIRRGGQSAAEGVL